MYVNKTIEDVEDSLKNKNYKVIKGICEWPVLDLPEYAIVPKDWNKEPLSLRGELVLSDGGSLWVFVHAGASDKQNRWIYQLGEEELDDEIRILNVRNEQFTEFRMIRQPLVDKFELDQLWKDLGL